MSAALGLQQHVIPGMVGNPFAFMRRADILALPSEEEGFGLVLIEAMASDCQSLQHVVPVVQWRFLEMANSGDSYFKRRGPNGERFAGPPS